VSGTAADEGATFSPSRPADRDGLLSEPEPADARRRGGESPSQKKRLSTFSVRRPVEVMADDGDFLQSLVQGERGQALRAQLGARYPDCSADTIDDAIQFACGCFLDEAEGITAPGQVYAWIRTAAHRALGREADRRHREVAVDPVEEGMDRLAAEKTDPVEELTGLEDDADLAVLVEKVSSSLTDRQRDVFALYGAGYKRPQIADRLGVPERDVKEQLRLIMDKARAVLAGLAGGGCKRGEPLVMRFICGISTPDEAASARTHISHCERCEGFSERLTAWREKAGAMLPVPAAEGASPGVVRQVADSAGEKLSTLKQHLLDGGAQAKQHVSATYYRAVDPTPLAAARPGTAAAVIASCIAIGGGAATYCVEQGVDPLGAAKGLIASGPETKPEETTPPEPEASAPTYTPESPVVEEPAPTPEPTPQPASSEPEPQPEPKPEPKPEDSFEPVSPGYASSSEGGSEETYEAPEAAPVESSPAPAPAQPGPQFGGP
jgi:RNA polymerase sigma factor (sigma-70 family)